MTHEYTRLIQLCPVTGEWFKVSCNYIPQGESVPDEWTQLVSRERIVAWGLLERWSTSRGEGYFTEEGGSKLEGTDSAAIVATGTTYTLIPDLLEADTADHPQFIGYFTREDLADPAVRELITLEAKEKIEAYRKTVKSNIR